MKLYKEMLSIKNNTVSYFHINVTQEMQQIWGKEIVEKALIISPEKSCYLEEEVDKFFNKVKQHFEISKNEGDIYYGLFNLVIWLTNGTILYNDTLSHSFKTKIN